MAAVAIAIIVVITVDSFTTKIEYYDEEVTVQPPSLDSDITFQDDNIINYYGLKVHSLED